MLYTDEHGGGCCGITHLNNFWDVSSEYTFDHVDEALKDIRSDKNLPHLVEVVLNSPQKVGGKREKAILDHGFKLVNSFRNGNTDNMCYIYHLLLEGNEEEEVELDEEED